MGQHKWKVKGHINEPGTEQWLTEGICQECRRKKRCSRLCKPKEGRLRAELMGYLKEKGLAPPAAIDQKYHF